MKMLQKSLLYIFAILIIAASAYLHKDSYRLFPMHIHAWAQADHLALSYGFIENGFDLFHPQTFVLNPQFPNDFKVAYPTTITAADMPFHAYLVAIIMSVMGTDSPMIFRLYTLIWSLIGLFYLFRLTLYTTKQPIWGAFITSAAAFSPVFVYYQDGFLPSIPCLTAIIIGIYNYFNYLDKLNKQHLYFALFWLMMAALWRSSYVIPLITLWCVEVFRSIRQKEFNLKTWGFLLLPAIPIVSYIVHNTNLRANYGSIFLSSPKPPETWANFIDIAQHSLKYWGPDYFSKWQWFFILPTFVLGSIIVITQLKKIREISLRDVFVLGYSFGTILFTLLMFQQFANHDYYFIDTLFLPILILSSYGFKRIPIDRLPFSRTIITIIFIAFAGKAFMNVDLTQKRRHTTEPWDRYTASAINFKDSNKLLDSLGIAPDAKIFVIDAYAPNIPLMQMKRKGFVVVNTVDSELSKGLTFPYDYVAFQNDYLLSDIIAVRPDFINKFTYLGGSSQISIYKDRVDTSSQTLEDFLGLTKKVLVLDSKFDESALKDEFWQNIHISSKVIDSISTVGEINADDKDELVFHAGDLSKYPLQVRQILLTAEVYIPQGENITGEFVEHIHAGENSYKYLNFPISNWVKETGKWQQIRLLLSPPNKGLSGNEEVKIILRNSEKGQLFYKNMRVRLYH
jgi:hypothetical protein